MNQIGKNKAEFLTVGEACKAIFLRTAASIGSGFAVFGTSISASAVPQRGSKGRMNAREIFTENWDRLN